MLMLTDKFHQYKTVETLSDSSEFGQDIEGSEAVMDMILETLLDEVAYGLNITPKEYINTYKCRTGATKAVIVCKGSSVVLKVPFNGVWYYDEKVVETEDGDTERITDYDNSQFDHFSFADTEAENNADPWNYCETELIIYENAVADGYGEHFAKVVPYGTTPGGYPLYLQERCQFSENGNVSKKSYDSFQNLLNNNIPIFCSKDWGSAFIERYGLERLQALNEYVEMKGLSDLHEGNLGYRESDGAPVITDSSGFFD